MPASTPDHCLLYYVTDRTAFAPDEPTRRRRLLDKVAEAVHAGVDYIQLREKDLSIRELKSLAREVVCTVNEARTPSPDARRLTPTVLINSRTDVALAVGADGVHLPSNDVSPIEVQHLWASCAGSSRMEPLIGVSCHSPAEVTQAEANSATFAVFAPVFEKKDAPGMQPAGLARLRQACNAKIPVLALGGVTVENAKSCLAAGAAGIAAIRLFQENDVASIVAQLRQLSR